MNFYAKVSKNMNYFDTFNIVVKSLKANFSYNRSRKILNLQGIRTQIVKSILPLREPNNDILAVKMV